MFRRGLFYSYLSVYLRHFLGMTVTETTLFATIPMVLNILCQRYVWGVLSDRCQKRRVFIVWGEILAGIGTLLIWWIHLLPAGKTAAGYVVIGGLSVIEIFWSMSNIGWSSLISDRYERRRRSSIMGQLESMGGLGRIAGVWFGGLLYDGLGTRYEGWGFHSGILFFISAAAMFLSVLPMLMVPEGGAEVRERSGDSGQPEPDRFDAWVFYGFIAAMSCINFGRNSVAVTMSQYLMLSPGFGLSSLTLSYVVNIRSVAMVLAGMTTGWLALKTDGPVLLGVGTLFALASLVLLGIGDSLLLVCVSSFLMGVSEVVILSSSYEIVSDMIPPLQRGRLFSLFNATYFLSWGLAGTFLSGPVIDFLMIQGYAEAFSYKISFLVASGVVAAGLAMMWFVLASPFRKTGCF